jgi:hypothetical protein
MTERPSNVIEALTCVMADLPAIGKDGQAAQQQGGYAYRGIEQITAHTQGLFAKYGVVFTPHVVSYEVRELTVNGKPWTDVYELVEYTVYGPGGREDCIKVGPLLAIGRDNSDKGANKCLTQAYKYALLQALCISDAKDDGDQASHVADAPKAEPEFVDLPQPLVDRLTALPVDAIKRVNAWAERGGLNDITRAPAAWIPRIEDVIAAEERKIEGGAPTREDGDGADGGELPAPAADSTPPSSDPLTRAERMRQKVAAAVPDDKKLAGAGERS